MFDEFVLAASTGDLSEERLARESADAIEFRMDLADDPLEQLDDYAGSLPLIVTNRAVWEGGEADGGGERREADGGGERREAGGAGAGREAQEGAEAGELNRLDELADAVLQEAVTAVDIELAALDGTAPTGNQAQAHAQALRETAHEEGAVVIASVHDFESTPSAETVVDMLGDATAAGDVAKVATTATHRGHALNVLEATHRATEAGHTVATMCMGEPGRHTRAVAPLYGSRIGYAPVDPSKVTAPGQYALSTLRDLVDRLAGE